MSYSATSPQALLGTVRVPGDKSISHRSLIFGAMAEGETVITGLLEADDVLRTASCLRALGVSIEKNDGEWRVIGQKWQAPSRTLYAGNAGTGSRLLMGAVAGQAISASFDGDASLRARPMGRILKPLGEMGLKSTSTEDRLPLSIEAGALNGITYRLPVASAQIKSAILLAGIGAKGTTVVEEPVLSRDHTERMLKAFGVGLEISPLSEGGRSIALEGGQKLKATNIAVPADPSSAAFPVAAALMVPGSDVTVEGVLLNEQRIGLFTTLLEMGADLTFENEREEGGERVADIHVRHSKLTAIDVPAERAPSMIDEYPILSVIATTAEGTTFMPGLEELRVKESDRLAAVVAGLKANGVSHEAGDDWLKVTGGGVAGGGLVATHMDHRIAMSFLILGLVAKQPVQVDSMEMIATSFPNFEALMSSLGVKFIS